MARYTFAQLPNWIRKCEARTEFIIKASAQKLFEDAQTPRAKGGLMPVDTAFLRLSFAAQIGSMPTGPGNASDGRPQDWEAPVALAIAQTQPGDVLFAGWTARYARPMEDRYAFMRTSAAKWQSFVDASVREARARIR